MIIVILYDYLPVVLFDGVFAGQHGTLAPRLAQSRRSHMERSRHALNTFSQPFRRFQVVFARSSPAPLALVVEPACGQMAPKRGVATSLRSLSNKRARIGNICRELEEKEREIEQHERVERDIVDIVQALLDDPQKILGSRRAVMSNQFVSDSGKGVLHNTIIKLDRVPDFWKQDVLSQLGREFLPENLKDKKSKCKGYVEKAFYRVTRTSSQDPVPSKKKDEFMLYFPERMKTFNPRLHKALLKKRVESEEVPPVLTLVADPPDGGKFTKMVVTDRPEICADIPNSYTVDASWTFGPTFAFKSVKLSTLLNVAPKLEFYVHTLFGKNDAAIDGWFPAVADWRRPAGEEAGETSGAFATPQKGASSGSALALASPPTKANMLQDMEKLKKTLTKLKGTST